jgi:hypothetical protein
MNFIMAGVKTTVAAAGTFHVSLMSRHPKVAAANSRRAYVEISVSLISS